MKHGSSNLTHEREQVNGFIIGDFSTEDKRPTLKITERKFFEKSEQTQKNTNAKISSIGGSGFFFDKSLRTILRSPLHAWLQVRLN